MNSTLTNGAVAYIKFTNSNTATNPTLNINNTGAKPIYYGDSNIPANTLIAGIQYKFTYDGTNFVCNNELNRLDNFTSGAVIIVTGNYNQTYNSGDWNFSNYGRWWHGNAIVSDIKYGDSKAETTSGTQVDQFVRTTGNQDVTGNKTFSDDLRLRSTATKGSSVSSNVWRVIQCKDASDNRNNFGSVGFGYLTSKRSAVRIQAYKCNAATDVDAVGVDVITFSDGSCTLCPIVDDTVTLGNGTNRFSQLYATTATIDTSDERVKDNITSIPNEVLDAWGEVQWSQFQFKDALAKKGDDARIHTGTIAQRIKDIFESRDLDAARYGLLCHDSWDASEETIIDKEAVTEEVKVVDSEAVYDEDGTEIASEVSHMETRVVEPEVSHVEVRPAGDLYSLRYEECFAIEAAYQRRRADRLEARIAAIEAKLSEM